MWKVFCIHGDKSLDPVSMLSRSKCPGRPGDLRSWIDEHERRAMHAVVALVADTHGWLDDHLCPALSAEKVTHILHAGDVALGKKKASNRLDASSLIAALEKVASVDAVRGNTDDDESLEWMLTYEVGDVRFFVHHGVKNEMHGLPDWKDDEAVLAALEPLAGGWREAGDIIVYGHSHQPRFVRHPRRGSGWTLLLGTASSAHSGCMHSR